MNLPLEELARVEARFDELSQMLGDPTIGSDPDRIRQVGQEQAELEPLVDAYRRFRQLQSKWESTTQWRDQLAHADGDDEMLALVEDELAELDRRRHALDDELETLLLPKDPRDTRNVILEIRAGTGGDEAGLFAADLYRMYGVYAAARGWHVDVLSHNETGIGGFKEIVAEIKGRGAFSRLKWESGVHRVQRIPDTESQGRIHTSTATVAVLPEVEEVEIDIPEKDIRIDVFRATGPGGQSVNTTDSAVRLTHLPSGIVISSQDEKSQLQNRKKAMQILRARLQQMEEERRAAEMGAARRSQIGSGERAEKIRTYNFPQNRVTDHRIGLTLHRLESVLAGDLDELIDALAAADRRERLDALRVSHH